MSKLHVGARAPWAVPFTIPLGSAIDGTDITRVIIRLHRPSGAFTDVDVAPSAASTTSVTATWALAPDGSSVPEDGTWRWRAFLYGAGNELLGWSEQGDLPVDSFNVPFPTL